MMFETIVCLLFCVLFAYGAGTSSRFKKIEELVEPLGSTNIWRYADCGHNPAVSDRIRDHLGFVLDKEPNSYGCT